MKVGMFVWRGGGDDVDVCVGEVVVVMWMFVLERWW